MNNHYIGYLKKASALLLIITWVSFSVNATVKVISPKTGIDTIRLALAAASVSNGDTFQLESGTYVETGSLKIYKIISLMRNLNKYKASWPSFLRTAKPSRSRVLGRVTVGEV